MEQRMTRAERKAERQAREARVAVRVFAKMAAKRGSLHRYAPEVSALAITATET